MELGSDLSLWQQHQLSARAAQRSDEARARSEPQGVCPSERLALQIHRQHLLVSNPGKMSAASLQPLGSFCYPTDREQAG